MQNKKTCMISQDPEDVHNCVKAKKSQNIVSFDLFMTR